MTIKNIPINVFYFELIQRIVGPDHKLLSIEKKTLGKRIDILDVLSKTRNKNKINY